MKKLNQLSNVKLIVLAVLMTGYLSASCQVTPAPIPKIEYATIYIRIRGEKIVYREKPPFMSPRLTMPSGKASVIYNETNGGQEIKDLAELINYMAIYEWELKTSNSTSIGPEDTFWLTFVRPRNVQSTGQIVDQLNRIDK